MAGRGIFRRGRDTTQHLAANAIGPADLGPGPLPDHDVPLPPPRTCRYDSTRTPPAAIRPTACFRLQAPFTASLNALPAVNFTVFAAGIWISAPVAGLRPTRAARACGKRPEADQLHRLTLRQLTCDRRDHRVDRFARGDLAVACLRCDLFVVVLPLPRSMRFRAITPLASSCDMQPVPADRTAVVRCGADGVANASGRHRINRAASFQP